MPISRNEDGPSRQVASPETAWASTPEARQSRVLKFHHASGTLDPDEPVEWRTRPDQFLHYPGTVSLPLARPPPRSLQDQPRDQPREALYAELFSYFRPALIPTMPLNHATLSQFLYDSLAVCDEGPHLNTGIQPRVNPSCGGFYPVEAHIIAPPVPDVSKFPFVAYYSPKQHALQFRAEVSVHFFDCYLPRGSMYVGLSTIFWREAWRHGNRAFRYCHLDVGHAIAAVTVAAAALGWDVRLLSGLGQRDLETVMGLTPYRPPLWRLGRDGPGKFPMAELQHPVCVLLIFPNTTRPFNICYKALTIGISNYFESIVWAGKPDPLGEGEHMLYNGIYVMAQDVERPEPNREGFLLLGPYKFWGSKSCPLFPGYENLMVREVVRGRRSSLIMDRDYHMEVEIFYQFLFHCLPSGYCGRYVTPKQQRAFPFGVLPRGSRVDVLIFVHRVQTLPKGLYCLVRNTDHFKDLQWSTWPHFEWERSKECSDMFLPMYRLLSGDLQEKVKEIADQQPIATDGCFTVAMVAHFDDIKEERLYMYPRLFWESGVLGQLLSLDAQALGISACEIGSFFEEKANGFFGFVKGRYKTLYLYAIGKPLLH